MHLMFKLKITTHFLAAIHVFFLQKFLVLYINLAYVPNSTIKKNTTFLCLIERTASEFIKECTNFTLFLFNRKK